MTEQIVPDSQHRGIVAALPQPLRDLAQLARFDRPIGWWLLFWPGAWGAWLAGAGGQWQLVGLLLVGAIAMRGAGCGYRSEEHPPELQPLMRISYDVFCFKQKTKTHYLQRHVLPQTRLKKKNT